MMYTSFVVITGTPGLLATFLVSRGILVQNADGSYRGVLPGMEWVRVPNPITTSGSGTLLDPYVYDTRAVFLVKFAHESEADQEADGGMTTTDGQGNVVPVNQYDWSRFGKWVKANSTIVDAPANYLISDVWAGQAYKINQQNVWLVRDNPERFGVWQ